MTDDESTTTEDASPPEEAAPKKKKATRKRAPAKSTKKKQADPAPEVQPEAEAAPAAEAVEAVEAVEAELAVEPAADSVAEPKEAPKKRRTRATTTRKKKAPGTVEVADVVDPEVPRASVADPEPEDVTEDTELAAEPVDEVAAAPAVAEADVEAPGSLDEPEVEAEVEVEVEPAVATRRRRRRGTPDLDTTGESAPVSSAPAEEVVEAPTSDEAPAALESGEDADAPTSASQDVDAELAAEVVTAEVAQDVDAEEVLEASTRSRRRRRGGRGRGRRGRGADEVGDGDEVGAAEAASIDVDAVVAPPDDGGDGEEVDEDDEAAVPTRLSARARRGGTGRRGRAGGTGRAGRRPLGAVSDETRYAIAESPPRRMLVTVGEQRTQLAVLEQRNLVEHYVTRRADASYVGNVYVGRVQNVLPGMEAAFVDIGKGRNGVLYAGEVNYDEADLEGALPRIEQTLKSGQTVLVQVTKDPMGTKGARLTQQLSIAGRYCVLAPGDGMLGISRKLPDDERERLRTILKEIKPQEYGLIVRTAAEGATREQLEADVERLVRIWQGVEARAEQAKPLDVVYSEPDLVIRVIRDVFGPEYTDLIMDSAELAEQVRDYLGDVSPELVDRVSVHEAPEGDGAVALFDAYEVTNQIRRALEKKVWLKSGGYLIVEKTEAMWVVDVNTGRFVGTSNLEETVLKNNIEAAQEIARQLRLRDMGGIIVIDFVDMMMPVNRDEVLKRFKRELARDKTKSRVMEISKLGLVQMTRKNVSQGLQESFTETCDCCEGRGRTIASSILG